jgi:cytochrome P450
VIAKRSFSEYKKVCYIRSSPFVGNLFQYRKDHLSVLDRLASAGDVSGMRFGPLPVIMFNKPAHIHSIMAEHAADFDKGLLVHTLFRSVIGDNLVSSEGHTHRRRRKQVAPSFQPHHLATYAQIISACGEQLQQLWSTGTVIDINHLMSTLAYNTISKVLFDVDNFAEVSNVNAAMIAIIDYLSHGFSAVVSPPYLWPLQRSLRTRKATYVVRTALQGFINEHRTGNIEHNDMLTTLLEAKDEDGYPMSDAQLIAECMTLFGAGQGTTIATALTWAWYLLSQHPQIYAHMQQEVDQVLQGRTPTYEDLACLPYCLQIYKETLRLYPPVYATARRALRNVEIDEYLISKGQTVLISPYLLHRRADLFPDPELFDPERFTTQRQKQLSRGAFLPFGAGPRTCIGMHFSLMEGHLLLATLAQRVRFSLVPGQTITPDPIRHLTLRPAGQVNMLVIRR